MTLSTDWKRGTSPTQLVSPLPTVDTQPLVTLISPSRISTYLQCPKRYDYYYNQNLTLDEPAKGYFNKGNYTHELMHAYYELLKTNKNLQAGSDILLAMLTSRIRHDFENMTDPSFIPLYGIITKVITRYIKEQSPKIDAGISVEQVERQVIYPLDKIALFGFADLVYRDRSKRLRIRDHKTGDKAWSKVDAQFSNQLLYYATILYKSTGEVPISEISYINTKEYVKTPTSEQAFTFTTVTYTERELEIYFKEICVTIENMLQSTATPFYGQHCRYCPFQTPCYLERKGINPAPIIATRYKHVERDAQGKHARFSQNNANGDNTN